MEIKRKDILSLGLLFCFLFCSEKVSAAEKLSFNFSGKAHIIFSEPTPEELKNSNITITSNLYGDNTQLVPNNYWITKRVDNDRYDICYKDWNSFFLRIDKVNYLVYKVTGQIGGSHNVVGDAIPGIRVQLNSKYHTVSLYFDSAYLELNTKTVKAEFKISDLIYLDSNAWEVTEAEEHVFHIRRKSFLPQHFWKVDLNTNKFYSVSGENFDKPVANEMNATMREIQFASAAGDTAKSNMPTVATVRNELDRVEAVRKFPDYWQAYLDLGGYYLSQGEFRKAAGIYAQYPPFKDKLKGNRIVVSNEAATAGFNLYDLGAVKEARQFLTISANSGTGSAASMRCEAFLLLTDGKYAEAAAKFYQLAKTYDHKLGYSHSLSLLYLLNRQKTAWEVFNSLKLSDYTPAIWNPAFVAHRMEGKSIKEIISWLSEGNRAGLSFNEVSTYFLRQSLVDRIPNKSTLKNLSELEKKETSPGAGGASDRPILAWFAEGYINLRNNNYSDSYKTFSQRSSLINNFSAPYRFALPYLIWSEIRSSHVDEAKQIIEHFAGKQNDSFEYHIAAAFYFNHLKNDKSAIDHLKLASYRISSSNAPFSPWYQLIEACERLYESSHNVTYRELMVSFAKRYQQVYPMYSWAYAVEAKYTQDPDDRRRALAMAQYLDPQSERISHFPESEKQLAMSWLKAHNPFSIKDVKEPLEKEQPSRQI